jgi:hypothetical protein
MALASSRLLLALVFARFLVGHERSVMMGGGMENVCLGSTDDYRQRWLQCLHRIASLSNATSGKWNSSLLWLLTYSCIESSSYWPLHFLNLSCLHESTARHSTLEGSGLPVTVVEIGLCASWCRNANGAIRSSGPISGEPLGTCGNLP